jgi:multiple sugar transport system permease protein
MAVKMSKNWPRWRSLTLVLISDILVILFILLMLLPFVWMILMAIKTPVEALSWPPTFLPTKLYLKNFAVVLNRPFIGRQFFNTVFVSILTTCVALLVASMAAYSLARVKLPWGLTGMIAIIILLMRMYPHIVTLVPFYMIVRWLRLTDTRLVLVISYTAFTMPFSVWMLLGFFQALPNEMEMAAMVDGAGMWQRYTQVALPNVAPGLVATGIMTFILAWNEFLIALVLTNIRAKTIPVAIAGFITDSSLEWGPMAAMASLLVFPVVILAFFAQRYLVQGLTLGAIKS